MCWFSANQSKVFSAVSGCSLPQFSLWQNIWVIHIQWVLWVMSHSVLCETYTHWVVDTQHSQSDEYVTSHLTHWDTQLTVTNSQHWVIANSMSESIQLELWHWDRDSHTTGECTCHTHFFVHFDTQHWHTLSYSTHTGYNTLFFNTHWHTHKHMCNRVVLHLTNRIWLITTLLSGSLWVVEVVLYELLREEHITRGSRFH